MLFRSNSSGARTPFYGTTVDHVLTLDILLGDGRIVKVGPDETTLPGPRELMENLAMFNGVEIREHFQPGLMKRWPGYALDRAANEPGNLVHLIAGSEGTLAAIVSAELKLVPTPDELGLGLIFFDSIAEAMQATTELLDLKPVAIEHIDRVLLDQTRGQREFAAARALLELDEHPTEIGRASCRERVYSSV